MNLFGLNVHDFDTSPLGYATASSEVLCGTNVSNKSVRASSFSLLPTLLHPKSRGSIRLRSNNPFDPPRIHPNYLTCEEDIQVNFIMMTFIMKTPTSKDSPHISLISFSF